MNREEIKVGQILVYCDIVIINITSIDNDYFYSQFELHKISYKAEYKEITWDLNYYSKYCRLAEQDEIDWYLYCKEYKKYFEKDYALEHSEQRQLREFIEENNLI